MGATASHPSPPRTERLGAALPTSTQELLNASQIAILPDPKAALDQLSAPAPQPKETKHKPPSKRRKTGANPTATAGGSTGNAGSANANVGGGAAAANATAVARPAAPSVLQLTVTPPPPTAEIETEAEAPLGPGCAHCGVPLTGELDSSRGPMLCVDCKQDQCQGCGRVDPIAVDEHKRCFGCMREVLLRNRLRIGALRGVKAPGVAAWAAAHQAHQAHIQQQQAAYDAHMQQLSAHSQQQPPHQQLEQQQLEQPPQPPQPQQSQQPQQQVQHDHYRGCAEPAPEQEAMQPSAGAGAPAALLPHQPTPPQAVSPFWSPQSQSPLLSSALSPALPPAMAPPLPALSTSPMLPPAMAPPQPPYLPLPPLEASRIRRVMSGATPPLQPAPAPALLPDPLGLLPAALTSLSAAPEASAGPTPSPTSRTTPPFAWERGTFTAGSEGAAAAAEWERPLADNHEELYMLLSSPARPSTPSHAPAPPYPLIHHATPPNASPLHTPTGAPGAQHPFAMLRIPPPSPHRGPSPRGEHRAMVEWTLASARHASPAWRAASPHVGGQSPYIHPAGMHGASPHHIGAVAGAAAASTAPAPAASGGAPASCCCSGNGGGSSASAANLLMPPPPMRLERSTSFGASGGGAHGDPRPGGFDTADPGAARRSPWLLERPSTDPRSSPAWPGPANLGSGWLGLQRPSTDPRSSPRDPLIRTNSFGLPPLGAYGSTGLPQASPRSAGTMLPPPPRQKSTADATSQPPANPSAALTDDDIESFSMSSFQYGSYLDLGEVVRAASLALPRGQPGELASSGTPPLPLPPQAGRQTSGSSAGSGGAGGGATDCGASSNGAANVHGGAALDGAVASDGGAAEHGDAGADGGTGSEGQGGAGTVEPPKAAAEP